LLTPFVCHELLLSPVAQPVSIDTSLMSSNDEIPHVPVRPFYRDIAGVLRNWGLLGEFPIRFHHQPVLNELPDVSDIEAKFDVATPLVNSVLHSLRQRDLSTARATVRAFFCCVGVYGVLRMLRLRTTTGSISAVLDHSCFPADRDALLASFCKPHRETSKLCVGARALAKHGHRHVAGWWGGELQGSDDAKNAASLRIVYKLLAQASWLNIHMLPHNIPVMEVRTIEGFGARWVYEKHTENEELSSHWTVTFRGFVEPAMVDGHEKGWKH